MIGLVWFCMEVLKGESNNVWMLDMKKKKNISDQLCTTCSHAHNDNWQVTLRCLHRVMSYGVARPSVMF